MFSSASLPAAVRRALLLPALLAAPHAFPQSASAPLPVQVAPGDPHILYSGRRDDSKPGEVQFGWSGARVRVAFEGESVGLWMDCPNANWMTVYVDGRRLSKIKVQGSGSYYPLADSLSAGTHTVEVIRATECTQGPSVFKGFALPAGARTVAWPSPETRKIEFIGDSITCGYGIEANDPHLHFDPATEQFCDTYAFLAARALQADYLVVAKSGIGMFRNYNGPQEGSPDAMPKIYDGIFYRVAEPAWEASRFVPDVACINLGTNDFSTKGVNSGSFKAAAAAFVGRLLERYPSSTKIVLLMGPMANRPELEALLRDVATQAGERVSFFEMSKQGAHGLGADYHPSQEQAKVNAGELARYLSELMHWPADPS
jgi:hypothetical protein